MILVFLLALGWLFLIGALLGFDVIGIGCFSVSARCIVSCLKASKLSIMTMVARMRRARNASP
jgi:uncharacterized membrane protein